MSIFNGRTEIQKAIGLFGWTRNGGTKRHDGVDATCPDTPADNTPVYNIEDGKVIHSKIVNNGVGSGTAEWGHYVTIQGTKTGLFYTFAHLASRSVVQGQQVKAGEQVGIMGNSGNARDGYKHVHFEVRKTLDGKGIDPTPYLGIKNAVGIYGTKQEDDMTKFKIYTPTGKVVSSQQVAEGVIGAKGQDGKLYGYVTSGDARMAREYTEATKSAVFEAMRGEMQENELILSVEE